MTDKKKKSKKKKTIKEETIMDWLTKVSAWVRGLTEFSLSLLALAVVLQLLVGGVVPFFPGNVVGNVVTVVNALGAQGLVGLAAVIGLGWVVNRQLDSSS
tara:strand:+ start:403 stop:702 length:300 start_codon:yes stop_codon:yes gene_type:complete